MFNENQKSFRDPYLVHIGRTLEDIESMRIRQGNRHFQLTNDKPDEDGVQRGLGLPENDPAVLVSSNIFDRLQPIEEDVEKELVSYVKKMPIYPYIKGAKGVGEKQAARLLAEIGDPYWHENEDRPRTVSELWAYCGYAVQDGVAQKRKRGEKSNWSNKAKMRAYLIATSCIKTNGAYRELYEEERASHDGVLIEDKPITKGHSHNRALRRVAKEVLKDMWIASRAIHNGEEIVPKDY